MKKILNIIPLQHQSIFIEKYKKTKIIYKDELIAWSCFLNKPSYNDDHIIYNHKYTYMAKMTDRLTCHYLQLYRERGNYTCIKKTQLLVKVKTQLTIFKCNNK